MLNGKGIYQNHVCTGSSFWFLNLVSGKGLSYITKLKLGVAKS